jgi:ABC-type transport system substrate-binding protein
MMEIERRGMTSKIDGITRRDAIKKLGGTAAIASLAGCGQGTENDGANTDSGGNSQLGERVPTLAHSYWTAHRSTSFAEKATPLHKEYWSELGIDTEITPVSTSRSIEQIWNDQRAQHIIQWSHSSSPDRLDPLEMLNRNQIAWAGNGGKPNAPNYANCEYTKFAKEQAAATSTEGRQEAINNALGIASNDIMTIPQMPAVFRGAVRV